MSEDSNFRTFAAGPLRALRTQVLHLLERIETLASSVHQTSLEKDEWKAQCERQLRLTKEFPTTLAAHSDLATASLAAKAKAEAQTAELTAALESSKNDVRDAQAWGRSTRKDMEDKLRAATSELRRMTIRDATARKEIELLKARQSSATARDSSFHRQNSATSKQNTDEPREDDFIEDDDSVQDSEGTVRRLQTKSAAAAAASGSLKKSKSSKRSAPQSKTGLKTKTKTKSSFLQVDAKPLHSVAKKRQKRKDTRVQWASEDVAVPAEDSIDEQQEIESESKHAAESSSNRSAFDFGSED